MTVAVAETGQASSQVRLVSEYVERERVRWM
jgi:hypothetical protein